MCHVIFVLHHVISLVTNEVTCIFRLHLADGVVLCTTAATFSLVDYSHVTGILLCDWLEDDLESPGCAVSE